MDQPVRTTRRFASDPLAFLSGLEASYADLASFRYGPGQLTLVSGPDAVSEVLRETEARYAKLETAGDDVAELLGSGLLLNAGEQWRRHRDVMDDWFGRDAVESYVATMAEEAVAAASSWGDGERVDVERAMSEVTLSVLADAMFGVSLSDATVRHLRAALEPVGARFEPDPLRSTLPDWLPAPGDREFRASLRVLETVVDWIVTERRATRSDDRERLLDALLDAYDDGTFSRRELRDELVTLLLAGHDTTALTLTYAWYLLAENPAVASALEAEVDALDGPVSAGDLDSLSVTRRVLQETLRLYPPAWLLLRRPTRDVTLAGYRLPADAVLLISPWAVQRSSRWYEAPESFDPSRWASPSSRPAGAYVPFGVGPRTCIGKQFALAEATVVLASVARRVRFADPPESVALRPTLTLHPREPVELTVRSRD